MRNQVHIKLTTIILLLAILTYVIPVHQLFHQHTASVEYTTIEGKVTVKSHENPCCKPIQFLKDAILTAKALHFEAIETSAVFLVNHPDKVHQTLFFISNKAPPLLS